MDIKFICCKGCERRFVGCHSDCKDYLDAKKKYDKEKEIRTKAKNCEKDVANVRIKRRYTR